MAKATLCRLCLSSCNLFKSLIDDSGQVYEVYDITVKYFNPKILQPEKGFVSSVICLECWKHIKKFHTFQQSILKAHSALDFPKQPILLAEFKEKTEIIHDDGEPNMPNKLSPLDIAEIKNNIIQDSEESFKCESCGKVFINKQLLNKHNSKYVLSSCIRQKLLKRLAGKNQASSKPDDISKSKVNSTASEKEAPITAESSSSIEKNKTSNPYRVTKIKTYLKRKFIENTATNIVDPKTGTTLLKCVTSSDKNNTNATAILPETSYTCHKPKLIENKTFSSKCKGELECVLCNNIFENYTLIRHHFQTKHPEIKNQILCSEQHQNRFKIMAHLLKTKYVKLHFREKTPIAENENQLGTKNINVIKPNVENLHNIAENQISNLCNQQQTDMNYKNVYTSMGTTNEIEETLTDSDDDSVSPEMSQNPTLIQHDLNICQYELIPLHRQSPNDNDDLIAKWKTTLECEVCKEAYTSYSLLKEHFNIKHLHLECYIVCCNLKLKESWDIVTHIRDFHSEISSNKYVVLRRQNSNGLNKIEKLSKPWKCYKCKRLFKNFYHFEKHNKKNHPKGNFK